METPRMYIVVNSELEMSPGKIAAQCAHSACKVTEYLEHVNNFNYSNWKKNGYTKIVLHGKQKDLIKLIQKYDDTTLPIFCRSTYDAGKTEIPEGSLTTIAFAPMLMSERPQLLKKMNLLN
jgi:PTH2 family peptidyl-tRNA hydrolase